MCHRFLTLLALVASLAVSSHAAVPTTPRELILHARDTDVRDFMIFCRRKLHEQPELAFEEKKTSLFLHEELAKMDIEHRIIPMSTGISARIGSRGPVVALRADMDALPIEEETEVPWRSKVNGTMHACGHDAHMAMLLGAAKMLKGLQDEGNLPGTVILLFQPAEEGRGGARIMMNSGGLQDANAIFGLHVWPSLPTGTMATRAGPLMAASERFKIKVKGKGGHGAMPHLATDPVVAASAVVLALQTLVSRETSPTDSVVITVARFNTGPGAANVIPDSVELEGTIRAVVTSTMERIKDRLPKIARSTSKAYGCQAEVDFGSAPYPVTNNEPGLAAMALEVGEQLFGTGLALALEAPTMASEDFSYYGSRVKSLFAFLGIGNKRIGSDVSLHNPKFNLDEDAMPYGAALHVSLALEYLKREAVAEKEREAAAAWDEAQVAAMLGDGGAVAGEEAGAAAAAAAGDGGAAEAQEGELAAAASLTGAACGMTESTGSKQCNS